MACMNEGWEHGTLPLARLTRHRQSQTQEGSVLVRTEDGALLSTQHFGHQKQSYTFTLRDMGESTGLDNTQRSTKDPQGGREGGRRQAVGRQDVHVDAHVDAHVEGA